MYLDAAVVLFLFISFFSIHCFKLLAIVLCVGVV